MQSALRAVVAVLAVAAVVIAAAAFFGIERSRVPLQPANDGFGVPQVASLGMNGVFGTQSEDSALLGLAFRQVERVYYEPVDSHTLVDGERSGILAYLKSTLHNKSVTLPPAGAARSASASVHSLDNELSYAQTHYAARLGSSGDSDLTQAALTGMMSSLHDPYTVYLSPDQIRSLNEQLDGGNFGGIGVFIYQLKNGAIVLEPIEGLPAAHAGMRGNEVVEAIDGSPISGMDLDKVERLIRGPEGTQVTITTHPYEKKQPIRKYRITREIIHVPTVHAKLQDGYEYIRLTDFGETSANEVRAALLSGKAHHAKGTILDLRDNGGGLLDAAVKISSYFVPPSAQAAPSAPRGVIVTEIDRYGNRDPQFADGNVIHGVTPIAILVNGFTASASEITSGALQDYKIATLIGTRTYGKGVVQGVFSLPNGGALKITTERYVTPAGRNIEHKGIEPNIVVQQSNDPSLIDTPRDKQLHAAEAFLNRLTR